MGTEPIIEESAIAAQLLDLVLFEVEQPRRLSDLDHPVTAYLNGLATSSRRPQLAALEAIAHRSTQVFTAETMPGNGCDAPTWSSGVPDRDTVG